MKAMEQEIEITNNDNTIIKKYKNNTFMTHKIYITIIIVLVLLLISLAVIISHLSTNNNNNNNNNNTNIMNTNNKQPLNYDNVNNNNNNNGNHNGHNNHNNGNNNGHNQCCDGQYLEEVYSVQIIDSNNNPVIIESAELFERDNSILLSAILLNQIIRVDRYTGSIINQPYITNVTRPKGTSLIKDKFYITSNNHIQVYDLSDANNPIKLSNIVPESNYYNLHFYNGLCHDRQGKYLYVTDAGFDFEAMQSTGTAGIWRIDLHDLSIVNILTMGTALRLNGCAVDNDGNLLFVAQNNINDINGVQASVYRHNGNIDDFDLINLVGNGFDFAIDGIYVDKNNYLWITLHKLDKGQIFSIDYDAITDLNANNTLKEFLFNEPTQMSDLGYDKRNNWLLISGFNNIDKQLAAFKIFCS